MESIAGPFKKYIEYSGFPKTTDKPTTYHRPPTNQPTNRPPTTDQEDQRPSARKADQPTIDQQKIWGPEISEQILNEFLIKNVRRVINAISRFWVITFLLKSECVIEKAKSWKVKLISVNIIQKLHLNKKDKDRWKLCRNYKTSRRISIQQMGVARL